MSASDIGLLESETEDRLPELEGQLTRVQRELKISRIELAAVAVVAFGFGLYGFLQGDSHDLVNVLAAAFGVLVAGVLLSGLVFVALRWLIDDVLKK